MNVSKIYGGPIVRLTIGSFTAGALANSSAEINWTELGSELASGQKKQNAGLGTVKIDLAEASQADINSIKALKNTSQVINIYTRYEAADNYDSFYVFSCLINYAVKRGFGDDPHIITVTAQRKTINESDFVARLTSNGGGGGAG